MIQLKELLTRKGLDAKRRKHEKETGLNYFYELYIIENMIMKEEFAGKTYVSISCKDILSELRKTGRKLTYSKKVLKEEIKKHLDKGGYKWFYKFGMFNIVVNEDVVHDNKLRVTYKDWFFTNLSVLICSILPLLVYFNLKGTNRFLDIIGEITLLIVGVTVIEILLDIAKYIIKWCIYKKYKKLMRG